MTQSDLKSLLFTVLCRALALDENAPASSAKVVPAYEAEAGPGRPIVDDVVYFYIIPESVDETRFQTMDYENKYPAISDFSSCQMVLIVYGPNASELAYTIRRNLYIDGHNMPLSLLRKHDIYAVPDPVVPALTWEEVGNRWRRRADLSISLRMAEKHVYNDQQGMVGMPPVIMIHK